MHLARGEASSGLGGAIAAGFSVVAACDFRPKMCALYKKHSEAVVINGDICKFDTLLELAKVFPTSGVIAAGISCQPYSLLGDGRGGQDPRSSTLPSTLSIAYHLRAMIMVLECVGPAQADPFVNHHINNFCSKTKFTRSDCGDLIAFFKPKMRFRHTSSSPRSYKVCFGLEGQHIFQLGNPWRWMPNTSILCHVGRHQNAQSSDGQREQWCHCGPKWQLTMVETDSFLSKSNRSTGINPTTAQA